MGKRLEYEIEDHGVEHGQYWQGAGVSFTDYDEIATGVADSARDAAEDAVEQMYYDFDPKEVDAKEVGELFKEIQAMSDKPDAHADCKESILSEYRRGALKEKPGKWAVSRQRPWNAEPAEQFIEIAPGGLEHCSPGQMVKPSAEEFDDPFEVAAQAILLANEFSPPGESLPIYFSTAECGAGEGDEETAATLRTWAEKASRYREEQEDSIFEKYHETCELAHRVSIRWRIVDDAVDAQ